MNFKAELFAIGAVVATVGYYLWRKNHRRAWRFFLEFHPAFFKTHYFKKALHKHDISAIFFLDAYGAKAIPEFLQILEKNRPQDVSEFDTALYNHWMRKDCKDPERIGYFKRFAGYCVYVRVLEILAGHRYAPALPLIAQVARSNFKRNQEAAWLLSYFGGAGLDVLREIIERKLPAFHEAIGAAAQFGEKGLGILTSVYHRASAESDWHACGEILLSLGRCGKSAIPFLVEVKSLGNLQNDPLSEKFRYLLALNALALLRHCPTFAELQGLLSRNEAGVQIAVNGPASHYFIHQLIGASFTLLKNEPLFIKDCAMAMLKYYGHPGIGVLKGQLRNEQKPGHRRFIKSLIKTARLIRRRAGQVPFLLPR